MASTDRCVEGSRAHAPHVRTTESTCALVKDGGDKLLQNREGKAEDWEMRIWIIKQWDNYNHWLAEG